MKKTPSDYPSLFTREGRRDSSKGGRDFSYVVPWVGRGGSRVVSGNDQYIGDKRKPVAIRDTGGKVR